MGKNQDFWQKCLKISQKSGKQSQHLKIRKIRKISPCLNHEIVQPIFDSACFFHHKRNSQNQRKIYKSDLCAHVSAVAPLTTSEDEEKCFQWTLSRSCTISKPKICELYERQPHFLMISHKQLAVKLSDGTRYRMFYESLLHDDAQGCTVFLRSVALHSLFSLSGY